MRFQVKSDLHGRVFLHDTKTNNKFVDAGVLAVFPHEKPKEKAEKTLKEMVYMLNNPSNLIPRLEVIQRMADEAAVKYTPHEESELSELYHAVTNLICDVQEGKV